MSRIATGAVTGLLWYFVLAYLDAVRLLDVTSGPGPHWGTLLGALVISGAAIWLVAARGAHFRTAVAAGLALGLLVGVLESLGSPANGFAADGHTLFPIPGTFARGITSSAVWTALGVSVALAVAAHPRRRRPSAAPRRERVKR